MDSTTMECTMGSSTTDYNYPVGKHSLHSDSRQAAESLAALLEKEKVYARSDYLASSSRCPVVTADDRLKIADWKYSVADSCQVSNANCALLRDPPEGDFSLCEAGTLTSFLVLSFPFAPKQYKRETVAIAMALLDRFLAHSPHASTYLSDRKPFQLLSMATLYVAIKTTERVAIGSEFLAQMSRGAYTKNDIEKVEMELLKGLEWRVNPPTAMQFICHILSLVVRGAGLDDDALARVLDESAFQAENAVRDYGLSQERQSSVAMAAMFNAAEVLDTDLRRDYLFQLSEVLDVNFAHPRELQRTRVRLRSFVSGDEEDRSAAVVSMEEECDARSSRSHRTCDSCRQEKVRCQEVVSNTGARGSFVGVDQFSDDSRLESLVDY